MIRTADFLYLYEEPSSVGYHAAEELRAAGLVVNNIPMQQADAVVIETLRASPADAIALYSPYQYGGFMARNGDALRALGKPIIAYVSEWTRHNPFQGYRAFEESGEWADFYACAHPSDAAWLQSLGRRAEHFPLYVPTSYIPQGKPLAERKQKLCFVGHVNDYVPGMYAERRHILAALTEAGLVDVLNIPRNVDTWPRVVEAFSAYAGVLCPPSNGRGHSIRCYEAAAAGALIVECQPLEEGNEWFMGWLERASLPAGYSDELWRKFVAGFDFAKFQSVATRAQAKVREYFNAATVWRQIFAHADTGANP